MATINMQRGIHSTAKEKESRDIISDHNRDILFLNENDYFMHRIYDLKLLCFGLETAGVLVKVQIMTRPTKNCSLPPAVLIWTFCQST